MLVDTHAHVYKENYENLEEVLKNAKEKNVLKIFNCAENVKTSKEIISLSKKYNDFLYAIVGIHPENVDGINKKDLLVLEKLIKENKILGIGEIGLDYHYEGFDKEKQIKLFEKMLDLATTYNLPVIVHSRDATLDTINILKKYNLKGIIHCFNGSLEIAREYIKMGYLLGINGIVTFKNCKLIEVIKEIGINSIVFETDCPFLTPEPYRKYKNEPKYIYDTMKFVSDSLKIDFKELEITVLSNIKRVFNIDL